MVHGLAGSAALILLILPTVETTLQGLIFILVFGAGSIIGMLITSTIIGLPFVFTANYEKINHGVKILAGFFSVFLGATIMYEIGIVNGLFL